MGGHSHPTNLGYEAQVDQWVREGASRHGTFSGLVSGLPGIYPSLVRESLCRQGLATTFESSERLLRLEGPVPHPIDGDWRFHPDTHGVFRSLLAKRRARELIILACPSLVAPLASGVDHVALADSNSDWQAWLSSNPVDVSWGDVSLAAKKWPNRFDAAIMDPPWYPFEFARFLAIASALLKEDGTLYVSFPAVGTRPGMEKERTQMLHTARSLGLKHIGTKRAALRYATPFYEGSALLAAKLPVLAAWRRSDLLAFRRISSDYTEQVEPENNIWASAVVGRLSLRTKPITSSKEACDPRLIRLIEDDVLPSVSQRDPRRGAAVVWTGGNRIFGCVSPDIFSMVATATMQRRSPTEMVEAHLGRALAADEVANISESRSQLMELEALEARTYDEMHEDHTRT